MKGRFMIFSSLITFFIMVNFIYGAESRDINSDSSVIKDKIETNLRKINSFIADIEIRKDDGENISGKVFYKSTPHPKTKRITVFQTGEKAVGYSNKGYDVLYIPSTNTAIKKIIRNDVRANTLNILPQLPERIILE